MRLSDRLPRPGQRIFRSMAAVWLCFVIYLLRGRHGIPFYSVIAALQCMQPYRRQMGQVCWSWNSSATACRMRCCTMG